MPYNGVVTTTGLDGDITAAPSPVFETNLGKDADYWRRLTMLQRERKWRYNLDKQGMAAFASTTDAALPGKFFEVLTNSGTATLGSTQSGYEGEVLSVTGAASGNTNSWLSYDAGLPVANRHYWCTQVFNLPIESASTLFDVWMGFVNKPGTSSPPSAPVDGCWWSLLNNGAAGLALTGNMANNSTTAVLPATGAVLTLGAATSIELGIAFQGQVGADFYYRVPATAPTFALTDQWVYAGSLSAAANMPRVTATLRAYSAHIARYAAANTVNMESILYGIENQPLR